MVDESIPLYARVERTLADEIAAGHPPPGGQLETEDRLIERFGVSRITVRRAVHDLVGRGIVEVRRGKGTFVAEARITQPLTSLTSFVEDMAALGRSASAKVLRSATVPADDAVADALHLEPGVPVTHIERVRIADGQPLSLDSTYLPADLGPLVVAEDLSVEPIFEILEKRLRVRLAEAVYKLSAAKADERSAAELLIEPGDPVFRIDRTAIDTDGRPVDHETLFYRGDAIAFETRLPRAGTR